LLKSTEVIQILEFDNLHMTQCAKIIVGFMANEKSNTRSASASGPQTPYFSFWSYKRQTDRRTDGRMNEQGP